MAWGVMRVLFSGIAGRSFFRQGKNSVHTECGLALPETQKSGEPEAAGIKKSGEVAGFFSSYNRLMAKF
jgi:hypothetical protein